MRINDQITSPNVRVINFDGKQIGVISINEALERARDAGLDLVEIVPNSNPPVCKIIDYGKYKYELSKKDKIIKKRQHVIHVKEIRLSPKIEEHDFNFKTKHARKFIEQGNKVKLNILFRGRQITHLEFGKVLIEKFVKELEDIAKLESPPNVEGRNMVAILLKK
ncbi:translation initiation factor IF-3 [candidate division KSB1 bacterium]|nr:translation initiation factor IF-3 [candidate division KSB1 bacterium]MBL7094285.1 translation initiation factor IF-3 [candidate division KSB1 bacterium]